LHSLDPFGPRLAFHVATIVGLVDPVRSGLAGPQVTPQIVQ
jgi:hypothetical protein